MDYYTCIRYHSPLLYDPCRTSLKMHVTFVQPSQANSSTCFLCMHVRDLKKLCRSIELYMSGKLKLFVIRIHIPAVHGQLHVTPFVQLYPVCVSYRTTCCLTYKEACKLTHPHVCRGEINDGGILHSYNECWHGTQLLAIELPCLVGQFKE